MANFFDQFDAPSSSGNFFDQFDEKPEAPPPEGGLIASLKQATGNLVKGAGQAAADYLPGVSQDNALKQHGQEVIDANPTAVRSLSDIATSPWTATKEAVGNAVGSMGAMVGANVAGRGLEAVAPFTGPARPIVSLLGKGLQVAGPVVAAGLPSYGGIREAQIQEDPTRADDAGAKARALAGAGAVGLIERSFGPEKLALSALSKEGRAKVIESMAGKSLAGSIGKGMAKGAAVEGAEELAQNPIEQFASYQDPTTAENIKETLFGGAMGALGGGVLGGAGGGISYAARPEQPPVDPSAGPLSRAAATAQQTGAAGLAQAAQQANAAEGDTQGAEPAADPLAGLSARLTPQNMRAVRQAEGYGPESVKEVLRAYQIARNPELDPTIRQQATEALNGFWQGFDNRPNWTRPNPQPEHAPQPGTDVVPFGQGTDVAAPGVVPPFDPNTLDGEAQEVGTLPPNRPLLTGPEEVAQQYRRDLLEEVLADPDTRNPLSRYESVLKKNGFEQRRATPDERKLIEDRTVSRTETVPARAELPPFAAVEQSRRAAFPMTQTGAERRAAEQSHATGQAFEVVPHPTVKGRFAVQAVADQFRDATQMVEPVAAANTSPERVTETPEIEQVAPTNGLLNSGEISSDEQRYRSIKQTPPVQRSTEDVAWANEYRAKQRAPAQREAAERVEQQRAKQNDTDGFAEAVSAGNAMRQAKVRNALNQIARFNGTEQPRKEAVRSRVASGATVDEREGQDALVNPDGSYLLQSHLTKTGIDYAKHLIAAKQQGTANEKAPQALPSAQERGTAQQAETVAEQVRDATLREAAVADRAEPVLDLSKRPTGWKQVDYPNGDGVLLISADGKKAINFPSRNAKSGTEALRAQAKAQAFAIDNPHSTESPKGELVVKPIFEKQAQQAEVTQKIAKAEQAGVTLSDADKATIQRLQQEADDLTRKADRLGISDPMNKGNAFPMGVGFTKMTKRKSQAIDSSVRRAGEAVKLYNAAKVKQAQVERMLSGVDTDAHRATQQGKKEQSQRELVTRLMNWKKGDKIGKFTIERVSKDRDGYPTSYTISGDGIVKGVMDKTDIARDFFGGDKEKLRRVVDEVRNTNAPELAQADQENRQASRPQGAQEGATQPGQGVAAKAPRPGLVVAADSKDATKRLTRYFKATNEENGPHITVQEYGKEVRIEVLGRSYTNYSKARMDARLTDGKWEINPLHEAPTNEIEREYQNAIRGAVEWLNTTVKSAKAKKEAAPAPVEQPRSDLDTVAERVTEPTHADPGQAPEAATAPVIREALQKSARNTPFNAKEAKAWLLAEIDRAIANVPPANRDMAADLAQEKARKFEVSERVAKLAKGSMRDKLEREEGAAFEAMQADRIAKTAQMIGFVTFDVPGDGKFKVVNTAENLQAFRDKVKASPGFREDPTTGMKLDPRPAGPTKKEQSDAITKAVKEGRRTEALDDLGNAIEIARLHGANDDPLLERFREIADKDYDAWRAEQDAEEEATRREEEERQAKAEQDAAEGEAAFAKLYGAEMAELDARAFPMTREKIGEAYGAANGAIYGKLWSSSSDRTHKDRLTARLKDAGLKEREAKRLLERAATIHAENTRGASSMTFLRLNEIQQAAEDLGFVAAREAGQSATPNSPEPRAEQGQQADTGADTATVPTGSAKLEGSRRDPTKVSAFTPYEDGDVVRLADGKEWQVRQDMAGWYLTSTGNWRGTHPTIQRIKAMNDLIRDVEQAAQGEQADTGADKIKRSFAGESARTADTHALATAQRRIAAGEDAEVVRQETGWHKAPDGKWRFEIDDSEASILPALQSLGRGGYDAREIASVTYRKRDDGTYDLTLNPPNPKETSDFVTLTAVRPEVMRAVLPDAAARAVERNAGAEDFIGDFEAAKRIDAAFTFDGFNALPLDQVIDHPALFAAYPALREVMVQVDPKLGIGGAFSLVEHADGTTTQVIRIGKGQQLSTLLHEIQHGIQDIEGFASGGTARAMMPEDSKEILARRQEILDRITAAPDDADVSALWDELDAAGENPVITAEDRYRRLAGETESRNTQARQKLTAAERRATSPEATADVKASDVIVVFNGTEMASAPAPANAAPMQAAGTTPDAIWSAVESIVGPIRKRRIIVVQSADVLVEQGVLKSVDAKGAQAFVKDGKAYFIAGNIQPGNERAVFLHEVGAHLGMEKILSPLQRSVLLNRIKTWAAQANGTVESRIAQAALRRVEAAGVAESEHDSELIAYAVEEAVKAGISPTTDTSGPIGQWFKTLWAAMTQALQKLGLLNPSKLTAQDIVDLAHGAANVAMSEEATGGGLQLSKVEGMRRGTREQAESLGYVRAYRGVSQGSPFNDSGTVWLTTSRDAAQSYAEEVFGYDDPSVMEIWYDPKAVPTIDMRKVSESELEALEPDEFGNPQKPGIYRNSDDSMLGGSGAGTVIHVPKSAVLVTDDGGAQFSRADPRIQFSRAAASIAPNAEAVSSKARDFLADVVKRPGSFGIFARSLNTQLHKATQNKQFKAVWTRANAMFMDAARAMSRPADLAPDLLPKFDVANMGDAARAAFFGKGKVADADMKAVADILSFGTLYDGADPTKGMRFTAQHLREGVRRQDGSYTKLTDEQIKLYEQARAAIDASLDESAAAEAWKLIHRYAGADVRDFIAQNPRDAQGAIADAIAQTIEQTKEQIENLHARIEALQDMAADEQEIKATERDIKQLERTVEDLQDIEERVSAIFAKSKTLQQAGYMPLMRFGQFRVAVTSQDEKGETVEYVSRYESAFEANRARRQLMQDFPASEGFTVGAVEVTDQDAWKQFKGVSPETIMLFAKESGIKADDVMQEWYKEAVSSRSSLRRMVHRKGYQGFSDDLPRVLASFITSNGKAAGYAYHLADMQQMLQDKSMPGDVHREARELIEAITEPTDKGAKMRGFMAGWYLLGSIASATINATQTLTQSLPFLSMFGKKGFAPGEAAKHLAGAYKQLLGTVKDADLRDALKRAEEAGTVDSNEVFHLYSEAMKPMLAKLGSGNVAYRARAFMALWGAPFAIVEKMNRKATFIAAWNMAKAQGKSSADAYAFGERAVQETQGIYAVHNRPNWGRTTIGGAALVFKQFAISYLELTVRMWQAGPEGKAAATMMLSILFLTAGLSGLPGEDDLLDLIDTFSQTFLGKNTVSKMELRHWLQDNLGKELGNFVNSGVSAFMPFDVSGRFGMGNLIPGTAMFKPSESNPIKEALEVFGVPGSFALSAIDGIKAAMDGNLMALGKGFAPKAVADWVKAGEMAASGEARDMRGNKITDVGLDDAFWQAVGFNPTVKASAGKRAGEINEWMNYNKRKESEIVADMARAVLDRDQDGIAEAQQALRDWNSENPEAPIVVHPRQVQQRIRNLQMERSGRIVKMAPPELRRRVEEALEE